MGINLDDYEPVQERVLRFKKDYPHFRMSSDIVSADGEIGKTRWIVKVQIWRNESDEQPAAVGHAFEVDGGGMTQRAAALETCETSALGRALANLGYVGSRKVTREEMVKVQRYEARQELGKAVQDAETLDDLRGLWQRVSQLPKDDPIYVAYTQRGETLKNAPE